jgi:Alcohol dehydrogenase GroES-like domain
MLTVLCESPGKLVAQDRPRPERQPGEVLLRVRRVGICGTDLHIFQGHLWYPMFVRELNRHGSPLYTRAAWEEAIRLAWEEAIRLAWEEAIRLASTGAVPVMKALVDLTA